MSSLNEESLFTRSLLFGEIFFFFLFLLIDFFSNINFRLPLGEIFSLIFFIENCFSLSILYLNKEELNLTNRSTYYCFIPEYDFLIFSFIACQALYLGYSVMPKKHLHRWKDFILKDIKRINVLTLYQMLALSFVGSSFSLFNISSLNQVVFFFNILFYCVSFALMFNDRKINVLFFVIIIQFLLISTASSGMTGMLIYFLLYFALLIALKINKITTLGYMGLLAVFLMSFIALSVLQSTKSIYRSRVWRGNQEASLYGFYDVYRSEIDVFEIQNVTSYAPLLFRLNQGYLVSSTMVKVPKFVDYSYGQTILNAMKNALIPRMFDSNKETAGGRTKIKEFTNLELIGSTSMNIGYLGEAYVNFGKQGAVIFIFFLGLSLKVFENYILKISKARPIVLVLFPIFFFSLIGTGSDFLSLFNSIVKGFFFVFFILLVFRKNV